MSIKPVKPNKRNLLINIDTVNFSVNEDNENTFTLPNTTKAMVVNKDGEILNVIGNRVPLSGEYGTHASKFNFDAVPVRFGLKVNRNNG